LIEMPAGRNDEIGPTSHDAMLEEHQESVGPPVSRCPGAAAAADTAGIHDRRSLKEKLAQIGGGVAATPGAPRC
jgi:hypothetical protein